MRRLVAVIALLSVGAVVVAVASSRERGGGPAPPVASASAPAVRVHPGGGCTDRAAKGAIPVRPVCTLSRALEIVPEGARIVLAPGRYPALELTSREAGVRIQSATPLGAEIPHVVVNGAGNVAFAGLRLTGGGTEPTFKIAGDARGVSLLDSSIAATHADGVALGPGVSDVTITRNTIATSPDGTGITFNSTSSAGGAGVTDEAPISDVSILENRIRHVGVDGIRVANFRRVTIAGNDITGVVEAGRHSDAIQVSFGGDALTIRGNRIHGNTGQGIFVKDGHVDDVAIENNLIVDNRRRSRSDQPAGSPLQVFDTAGLRIVNNTVWGNDGAVLLRPGVSRVVIRNNLLEGLLTYGEDSPDPAAFAGRIDQDYNLVAGGWSRGAVGKHDISAETNAALRPRFRSPAQGDWGLAGHSPGIDAGTSVGAPPSDMLCAPRVDDPVVPDTGAGTRPFVDLGALETGAPVERHSSDCAS